MSLVQLLCLSSEICVGPLPLCNLTNSSCQMCDIKNAKQGSDVEVVNKEQMNAYSRRKSSHSIWEISSPWSFLRPAAGVRHLFPIAI